MKEVINLNLKVYKYMNKKNFTPLAIIIIVVCAVLIGGIVVWQYYEVPEEKVKTTEGEEIVTNIELAENTVKGYENALKTRNRDEVLPYTTGELREEVQGWPPVFGTSNPHPESCEILSSKKISENEFEIKARHFEEYTGEGRIGYNDNTYAVNKIGNKYLISSIEYGEYVKISESDWETYRNEEYGFEIKYFTSWWISDESKNFIGFSKKDPEELVETVMLISIEEISLEEVMKEVREDKYVVSIEETIISGEKAYKIKSAQKVGTPGGIIPELITFVVSKKGKVFGIVFNLSVESIEIIDYSISTFRFIE